MDDEVHGWIAQGESQGSAVGAFRKLPALLAASTVVGVDSAREDSYAVYLFDEDGECVYLSLNQATENVRGGSAPLRKRALDLKVAAGAALPGGLADIDLASQTMRPRRYEAGNVVAFQYLRGQVPEEQILLSGREGQKPRFSRW